MRNIRDLPRGGGASSGREMWFGIEADDGEICEFRLPLAHVDAFIAGLRTFEAEAWALRTRMGEPPPEPAFLKVETTVAERGPFGDLELTLSAGDGRVRVAVPPTRIKAFLFSVVRALRPDRTSA